MITFEFILVHFIKIPKTFIFRVRVGHRFLRRKLAGGHRFLRWKFGGSPKKTDDPPPVSAGGAGGVVG